jgi:intracellular septation protein A
VFEKPDIPIRKSQISDLSSGWIASTKSFKLVGTRPATEILLTAGLLLTLFIAFFAIVQFATPALIGTDGYYHIKMGYLIRQNGLKPGFEALPLTILNEGAFYDHHLLYHLYLALFTSIDPAADGGLALTQGAKIASILLPSLAFLTIWWLLRDQKVPWAAIWTLGLFAVSEAFLYRMSMPRAQAGSLLLLALSLYLLLNGRYKWLLPLGFFFVWFYNAFPLLVIISAAYAGISFFTERRLVWQALVYPLSGILLGLLINPYFPENISFIVGHFLPKLAESTTPVGTEWSPYRTETLLNNSAVALIAVVFGVLALAWRRERADKATLLAFSLVIFFGYLLFRSRRFIEYFPAFALIFMTLSLAPLLRGWQRSLEAKRPGTRYLMPAILFLILAYPIFHGLGDARELISRSKDADHYADAALWLKANSNDDAMIFQTDWDDFTRLYFYNSEATYTAGLDPTFMELQDKALFDEWVNITKGKVNEPGAIIRDRFAADFVFSDLKHGNFMKKAETDPLLEEIYRDEYAVIFQVN